MVRLCFLGEVVGSLLASKSLLFVWWFGTQGVGSRFPKGSLVAKDAVEKEVEQNLSVMYVFKAPAWQCRADVVALFTALLLASFGGNR